MAHTTPTSPSERKSSETSNQQFTTAELVQQLRLLSQVSEPEEATTLLAAADRLCSADETSLPRLEFNEHCGCCTRNKITLDVFGPSAQKAADE